MRTFQLISLILFLILFIFTTLGTYQNLKTIISKRWNKTLKSSFLIFHLLVFLIFIYLYIYPNQPRGASNYSVYLIFNFILFAQFIFNLPNAISYLLHIIFTRRKAPVIPYSGFIIGIGIVLSMAFGTIVGSRQVKTESHQVSFDDLPARFDGYKIFMFTDTHLGGMLFPKALFNKAAKVAEQVEPDLVLFAGDLVNNFAYETEVFMTFFCP